MSDVTLNPSITPNITTTAPQVQNVQAPAVEETKQSYTPLWMVNDSVGTNAFEMLGMRLPKASGDISAMLAQISLTLELSIDESDKNRALSGLAKIASALGAFGVTALREMIGRNETAVDGTAGRLADYNKAAASLVSDRNTLNTRIGNYNTQISSLEGQLSSLQTDLSKAKDADKPAIQAQIDSVTVTLNAAKTGRSEALASRKAVEVSLANLKIETLDAQITDLRAQLAEAPEGSDEATKLTSLISDLDGKLSSMKDHLSHLKSDAYTENSGNGHFNSTDSSFTGGFTAVQNTLGTLVSDGLVALETAALMATAIAAQAAASFNAANSVGVTEQREIGVERNFDDISDELKAAGQRLQDLVDKSDLTRLDRIGDIARGLLAAISDIVQALDGLGATAGGAPPVGETVGNRLRLGI